MAKCEWDGLQHTKAAHLHGVDLNAEVGELLEERGDALAFREVDLPGPVEAEDVAEELCAPEE